MKILQLKLLAFGPFTDLVLELRKGQEGLNVIYGPNEAGKSSALRGLRQLLYGIPPRSSDDFVHPYSRLRIGGELRRSDGAVLDFIRRKGTVNTLRAADDARVIDERELRTFLGGVDGDLFETMFGINHSNLVRGGEEIIHGGGEVGRILFAAGSGISDLRKVHEGLQAEAEGLFKPAGQRPKINEAIVMLREKQKSLREAQLSSQEWAQHDEALRKALEGADLITRDLQEKQREKHHLERIKEALPHISQRKELLEKVQAYSDAVILPQSFADRRQDLVTNLRIAEQNEKEATQNLCKIREELAELKIPEQLLEQKDLIEQLNQDLGSHRKAVKDRSRLVTMRGNLRAEAQEILSGLRRDVTLDKADQLKLTNSENVRVQELSDEYQRLVTKLDGAQEQVIKLTRQVDSLRGQLSAMEKPRDCRELRKVIERVWRYGALEEQYRNDYAEIRKIRQKAEKELSRQTLWVGTLEELQELPIPGLDTIDVFEQHLTEAQALVKKHQSGIDELEHIVVDLHGQMEQLRLQQEVPTEEELFEARRRRDQGWQLVRQTWGETDEVGGSVKEYIASFPRASDLADAYELAVGLADELADRLRREADRVAKKATLIANRETHKRQIERLRDQLRTAEIELAKVNEAWAAVWGKIEVSPMSPREMRAWAQNQSTLAKEVSAIIDREAKAEQLNSLIATLRSELTTSLESLGEPLADTRDTLADLLERSQEVVNNVDKITADGQRLAYDLKQREDELREAELEAKTLQGRLLQWRTDWNLALGPLGLDDRASPAQAKAVLQELDELFGKLRDAEGYDRRIRTIDRDAEGFSGKVRSLAERVARDLLEVPVEQAAGELNARLTHARTLETQQQSLRERELWEQQKLQGARDRISEIHAQLVAMCLEARCENYENLPLAEQRSAQRQRIEEKLEELEEQLRRLSGGASLKDFVDEALMVDPDGIDPALDRLADEITKLGLQKSELDQRIGSERTELRKMDGSAKAAELAEDAQGLLARLESDAEQYVRLRLASEILSRAVESYRERHQGPIMRRSSELFAHLTSGWFEGLRLEFNEKGDAILVGVRPGGKEIVGVEGMSDGTTDQLYLAVRLASLETYLENNEPLPFIVDDILIKFDDDRATAALQALAELSKRTQVIFFTHHRRLVELAQAHISGGVLFTHTLGGSRNP
jgi:uncharacterized protein YhaN